MAKSIVTVRPALAAARKLGRTPRMFAALKTYAEAVEGHAKRYAPRGGSPETEGYRDQIEATVGARGRGPFIGRVNAKKFTSHWIEFGTVKMRAFAPLRRGLQAAGFKVFRRR